MYLATNGGWRLCPPAYQLFRIHCTFFPMRYLPVLAAVVSEVAPQAPESPLLYRLVEQFVGFNGKGVIKKLILDRGFLDGPNIGRCKQEWGIDVLIPARRNMDIYQDVVGLAKGGALDFKPWIPSIPHCASLRYIGLSVSENARKPDRGPLPGVRQELVLTLDKQARKKILAKTRRLRRSLANQLANCRPP